MGIEGNKGPISRNAVQEESEEMSLGSGNGAFSS